MINLVGDHAVRHRDFDAPLTSDVAGVAAPFSDWVHTATSPDTFAADAMQALAAANSRPGQIATLIAPADIGWDAGGELAATAADEGRRSPRWTSSRVNCGRARRCVGRPADRHPRSGDPCSRIRRRTGPVAGHRRAPLALALIAPSSNRRIDRGAGRVNLPSALRTRWTWRWSQLESLSARPSSIEAQPPVAFFAYPGSSEPADPAGEPARSPSLPPSPRMARLTVAGIGRCHLGCLPAPVAIDAAAVPERCCRKPARSPTRRWRRQLLPCCRTQAIVIDESLTCGRDIFDVCAGSGAAQLAGDHRWGDRHRHAHGRRCGDRLQRAPGGSPCRPTVRRCTRSRRCGPMRARV